MAPADFCPAVRPHFDSLSRRSDTEQISWGKLSRLLCTAAESTLRTLDGYGLRGKLPTRPADALYPVFVHRLAHLIHASFRPSLAAAALASSLGLHLHQVGRRTFTSKLLNMPSTQRSGLRPRLLGVLSSGRVAAHCRAEFLSRRAVNLLQVLHCKGNR